MNKLRDASRRAIERVDGEGCGCGHLLPINRFYHRITTPLSTRLCFMVHPIKLLTVIVVLFSCRNKFVVIGKLKRVEFSIVPEVIVFKCNSLQCVIQE